MNKVLRTIGIGAFVGGGVALFLAIFIAALLIGPFIFWLAWNVLDFGPEIGLPELGFWSIVLATLFLIVGWFGKSLIAAIVFIVDPGWLDGAAQIHWPHPSFSNFIAIVLLAMLASRPHAHAHKPKKDKAKQRDDTGPSPTNPVAQEVFKAVSSAIAKEVRDHTTPTGGAGSRPE